MQSRTKFFRELIRLLSPRHWLRRIAFLIPTLTSKYISHRSYQNILHLFDECPKKSNIFALILYSPNGIRTDTKRLIGIINEVPNSFLVILSKCSLSSNDQDYLRKLKLTFLEQENFGYDFGSYRDVCLSLINSDQNFNSLTLLNDSFLFPNLGEKSGAILHVAPSEGLKFYGLITQGRKRPRNKHVGSFHLSFSAGIFRLQRFRDFWWNYRPSNNRDYTIRAGEIALSQTLIREGIEPNCLYNREDLISAIHKQNLEALHLIADGFFTSEIYDENELKYICNLPLEELKQALAHAVMNTENLRLTPAYTYLCGMPLIKKRNLRVYPKLKDWYTKALNLNLTAQ